MPEQSNSSKNSADTKGVDARALAYVKAGPKLSLIGGRWVPARSGEMIETVNPASGEALTRVALAWSPLAGGLLTGKERMQKSGGDAESSEGMVVKDDRAERTVGTLLGVAKALSSEPSSVALAWVMAKGLIPVMGPRTESQLAANLAATAVRLSDAQVTELDEASGRPLGYPYELLAKEQARIGITGRAGDIL